MSAFIDLTGKTFNRLTVNFCSGRNKQGKPMWNCTCECGDIKDKVLAGNLKNGNTKSCGCLSRETLTKTKTTHGHSLIGRISSEYNAWNGMKQRCLNSNNHAFSDYGERGITVYPEWINNFKSFLEHVGLKPSPEYSIDRIDNDGNYEPGNVKWSTKSEQMFNRRSWKVAA